VASVDSDTDSAVQGLVKVDSNAMVVASPDKKPAARDSFNCNPEEEENPKTPVVALASSSRGTTRKVPPLMLMVTVNNTNLYF
jgi:hypothetical protein